MKNYTLVFSTSLLIQCCFITTVHCENQLFADYAQSDLHAPSPYRKVLFLGNSITKHGPKADIGWEGNWGMAASSEAKDYVHLVAKTLSETSDSPPQILVKNIAAFERSYNDYDISGMMEDAIEFDADLIILAIGENVPGLGSPEDQKKLQTSVARLLTMMKGNRNPTIIVRSCFWANEAKDNALKVACDETGGVFVDIGRLGKDESNYARSEREFKHQGVAAHPGDKGMKAIANAILEAIDQIQSVESKTAK